MSDKNNIERLRVRATELLDSDDVSLEIKELVRDLGLYHTELEYENKELSVALSEYAASRLEFVDLYEDAPVAYVVIDETHAIRRVNHTFVEEFIPPDSREVSYEGLFFEDYVYPESRQLFYLFCKILQKPGNKAPLEIKLYDRFRMPRQVAITAGKYQPDATRFMLTISDITHQKTRELKLEQAKVNAEEDNRQKSLFLAGVSQEVRTPLTAILGFCELLRNSDLSPETRKEYLDMINVSGKMLMSLADELVDLSLLESGRIPLTNCNVDLAQICEEVVLFARGLAKSKGVQIESEFDDIPILWGDPRRLRQIFSTVLNHAAANATEGIITVRCRFVANDGVYGVLIFNIYGKDIFSGESELKIVDRRMTNQQNLVARGMYNTSQVVKAMNGKMFWIHPLDSLRIEIPIEISHHPELNADRSENADQTESLMTNAGRTCLVVDDSASNLELLDAILRQLNFVPTLAGSAKEAMDTLALKHFDVIITDLWMPVMNGEQLARMIRQNPNYSAIPIYAVTADVDCAKNFDLSVFKKAIIKPISVDTIRAVFAEAEI